MNSPTPLRARVRGQRMRKAERRDAKRIFLKSFACYPFTRHACQAAGISRSAFYGWLTRDALFAKKYQGLLACSYDPRWIYMEQSERKAYLKLRRYGERIRRYYAPESAWKISGRQWGV